MYFRSKFRTRAMFSSVRVFDAQSTILIHAVETRSRIVSNEMLLWDHQCSILMIYLHRAHLAIRVPVAKPAKKSIRERLDDEGYDKTVHFLTAHSEAEGW